ncbi:unnamed protein product, partial [Prunus brigantina]
CPAGRSSGSGPFCFHISTSSAGGRPPSSSRYSLNSNQRPPLLQPSSTTSHDVNQPGPRLEKEKTKKKYTCSTYLGMHGNSSLRQAVQILQDLSQARK